MLEDVCILLQGRCMCLITRKKEAFYITKIGFCHHEILTCVKNKSIKIGFYFMYIVLCNKNGM